MDDPDCDSTWEGDEEEDGEGPGAGGDEDGEAGAPGDADAEDEDEDEEDARAARPGALQARMLGSRNWRAMRDTRRYRHHYPDLIERDGNGDMPNLSFYRNEIRFLPNGCFIEDILQNWREEYDLLEENHSYIQWLFPLREPGVNWHAKPLTLREVEAFKSSEEVRERFVQAYELMLGFYGIQLEDRDTGQVCRAQNYQKRFQNLNWHSHNNLRITRILKSLGELGLEHYQAPLARFFLEETLVRRELPAVRQSALDYFVFTVRCPRQRRQLLRFAWEHFRPRRKFVWGPHDKLRRRRPPLPARPAPAEGEGSPGDPLLQAGASGQTCGPGGAGGPPPPPGALARDQGGEAWGCGEEEREPPSPKESKKRKLEANRREQAPGELGAQSASDVEKIALNLEGCALSQGSLGGGSQELGSQAPGEAEPPCPQPPGAKVAEEVRKRRKVDQDQEDGALVGGDGGDGGTKRPASAPHGAATGCPEAREGENGVEEAEGWAGLEQAVPGTPATAKPWVDKEAEVGL
ncbi:opioid growth factor receptor [Ursus maritimus]|uniref:Opioid growth factor receptor n=1 Tax=Ursus maritimus TaxID=29073 RepID=A0A8M1GSF7_URSMA|nr:opioid growth factor receptor [Ursus arctos]XP_040494504.1 opioid growth factor receptor [Ursus maritimus]